MIQSDLVSEVTIRELRNHGGDVIARVTAGETLIVTRDGTPVAELRPITRDPLPIGVIKERWARLPHVDPMEMRRELDAIIDSSL